MPQTRLPQRGVVKVVGEDARSFLQRVLSCNMQAVTPDKAAYGALLTPQGKILVDFLVAETPEALAGAFLLDAPLALAPDLMKRLNLYKLRANVIVEDISAVLALYAGWGGAEKPAAGLVFDDPRHPDAGWRQFTTLPLAAEPSDATAYDAHRIRLGLPEGGRDFLYGDTFPHEANLDLLHGVDFAKGCYVGQEVVSRMQHKTDIRKRIVPLTYAEFAPETGLEVRAGEQLLGMLGSCAEGRGLALVRIDKARDAMAAGVPVSAGGVPINLILPQPKAAA